MREIEERRETLMDYMKVNSLHEQVEMLESDSICQAQILSDLPRQVLHFLVRDVQDPVFHPQSLQLLLLERDAKGQRSDVPMHMTVALLAAQGQDIHPFRLDCFAHGLRRSIDDTLKGKIFLEGKVARHLLFMRNRRDQRIPVKHRIFIEKNDEVIGLADDVVAVQTTGNHFADETRILLNPLDICIEIKWFPALHARQIGSIVDQRPDLFTF